jgi:tetratricopeptide (TPR) repeat protein
MKVPAGAQIERRDGATWVRSATIFAFRTTDRALLVCEWVGIAGHGALYNGPWLSVDRSYGQSSFTATKSTNAVQDEWHHIAFLWKGTHTSLYFDGFLVGRCDLPSPLTKWKTLISALRIGPGDISVDDFRVSSVARKREELGFFSANPVKPDVETLVLEDFDREFMLDGRVGTATGFRVSEGCRSVGGKWGKALALLSQSTGSASTEQTQAPSGIPSLAQTNETIGHSKSPTRLSPDEAALAREHLRTAKVLVEKERARSQFMRRYDEAIEEFARALMVDPHMAEAYLGRGCAQYEKGTILITLAPMYRMPGEPDYGAVWSECKARAKQDFDKALQLAPNYAEAYAARSRWYLDRSNRFDKQEGDVQRALDDASKATDLDTGLADAWYVKGEAYRLMARKGEALTAYRKFLELASPQDISRGTVAKAYVGELTK